MLKLKTQEKTASALDFIKQASGGPLFHPDVIELPADTSSAAWKLKGELAKLEGKAKPQHMNLEEYLKAEALKRVRSAAGKKK